MKPRTWLIGDTHFNHARILEYESEFRPFSTIEDHDEALVQNWNSVVKPGDFVWHLGDFGMKLQGLETAKRLNGRKKIVLGNHDNQDLRLYYEHFEVVCVSRNLAGCLLTHRPVHPIQFSIKTKFNIHGHMHSKFVDDPRYLNVSVERINLTPISLEEALSKLGV